MKFTTLLPFLVVAAQAASIKDAVTQIITGIDSLDAASNAFDGDINPVTRAADLLIQAISTGQQAADASQPIGLFEAAGLLGPVGELKVHANTLFNDIKGRVVDVQQAKACGVIGGKLDKINSQAGKLIDTMMSKLSSSFARGQAQPFADEVKGLLGKAQGLFGAGHCVDVRG